MGQSLVGRRILCILVLSAAAVPASAEQFWQLHAATVTVLTHSAKAAAKDTITAVLRTQQLVRWAAAWPRDYQPPVVLALELSKEDIDEYFGKSGLSERDSLGPGARQSFTVSLPQMTIIIFTMSRQRGLEFAELRDIYGGELLDTGPTRGWPESARIGLGMVVTSAELASGNMAYVHPGRLRFPGADDISPMPPADFIRPAADSDMSQATRTRWMFSSYMLALMTVAARSEERAAYARYYELLGEGQSPGDAAQAAFAISDAEFTSRFMQYARRTQFQPAANRLSVELGEVPTTLPEPDPVTEDDAHRIILSLRDKLGGILGKGATPALQ
jgi:hypothetical protein